MKTDRETEQKRREQERRDACDHHGEPAATACDRCDEGVARISRDLGKFFHL